MNEAVLHSAPRIDAIDGLTDVIRDLLGRDVIEIVDAYGELSVTVVREALARTLETLRDRLAYQQLMEIAGVDYPERAERFEVCYHLLSVTKNHRLRVKVQTDEDNPVPTVTHLWPVAGWLEREVFDLYGVLFEGNTDLRRILTDYGFRGHPELRYSEEQKRVVYEPVRLAQDFRSFDFMSPWEGAKYVLPGDEKAPVAPTPPAPPPPPPAAPPTKTPKTTDKPSDTGAGEPASGDAAKRSVAKKADAEAVKPARTKKADAASDASARPKTTRARKPRSTGGDA